MRKDLETFMQSGGDGFLTKPYELTDLQKLVIEHLPR